MVQYAFRSSMLILALISSAIAFADSEPPTTPQLSFSIYSGSNAELFWTRSADDSVNLVYRLERDDEAVYIGDGLSFYDDGLSPGQQYNYWLTVQGEDGLISEPVGIGFDTNDRFLIGDETVLPPQGLRADVYSSSALELFWDRVPDIALDYEISQDGSLLGSTDGTSFFINSGIEGDGIHTFEVTAVRYDDPGITYSEPAFIRVNIADGSTSTESPLSSPQNVNLIRYSSTAAELFWDRPSPEENVVSTEIYRNGDLIVTSPGTSFFDDSRTSDMSYTYELVAINSTGDRSEPSILVDNNGAVPPETTFTLDETNQDSFIENVARIVSGNVFNDLVSKAISLGQLSIEGLSLESVTDARPPAVETSIYACEGGGQLISDRPTSAGALIYTNRLENCILDGEVYNGSVRYENTFPGHMLVMNDLQRTYSDGSTTTISGEFARPDDDSIGTALRSLAVSQYTEENADGTRRPVSNFVTTSIDATGETRPGIASALSSTWTASGPFSSDLSITATTLVEFDRQDSTGDYTRGTLLMEIEDVMTVTLDADNGDPGSFQLFVLQGDVMIAYTHLWNDSNRFFMPFDFP